MREPRRPLRLWMELTDERRLLPRILSLTTGRAFSIHRSAYQETAPDRGTLLLELEGPEALHDNLVGRIRALVNVLTVSVLQPAPPDGTLGSAGLFSVPRARVSTRMDGGAVLTDATIALVTGDATLLVAGEGSGQVEALAEAFERGLSQLYPSVLDGVSVEQVLLSVRKPKDGLRARVEVDVSASDGVQAWQAHAVTNDVAQAGVQALTRLYSTLVADRQRMGSRLTS